MSEKLEAKKNIGTESLNSTQFDSLEVSDVAAACISTGPDATLESRDRKPDPVSEFLYESQDWVENTRCRLDGECSQLWTASDGWLWQRHQIRRWRDWHGMEETLRKKGVGEMEKRLSIVLLKDKDHVGDIEDLVEETAKPTGKHRTHDVRGKSSKNLKKDFSDSKVSDEFVKADLEHSLWYAREFFLKKQEFEKLKEASIELVPYFVNWCRGGNFPTYEKFLRVKGKVVTLKKGSHIRVRRVILIGLSRQDSSPFARSIKLYLAGGVKQDKAQGLWKVLRRCFGCDAAEAYVDGFVDSKINSLSAALRLVAAKEVNHLDRLIDQKIASHIKVLKSKEGQRAIADTGLGLVSNIFTSISERFSSLVKAVYEWCKENYKVLVCTMAVIIVTAVVSCAAVPVSVFDIFGEGVSSVVEEDVAQSFGVKIGLGTVMSWLKGAASHMRDCKSIVDGVKSLWECLVDLVDYAWETVYGVPFTSKAQAKKGILETIKVLSDRLEEYDPSQPSDPEKDSAYVAAYRELLYKAKLLTFDKNLHMAVQALLSKYVQEYMNTMSRLSCGKTRVNPLCVYISGPPGSGKSTMVQPLIKTLYSCEHEDVGDFSPRWKYDWKTANEYQDTYDNQFAILMDDVFQMTDASVRMAEAMEIISLVNTAPYPVHTAAVEKKGKTFCNSSVIVLTSNDNKFHDVGLSDLSALKRRFHVKIYTNGAQGDFSVDVELLQGVVNGHPYWALYNDVKPQVLHNMMLACYAYYREPAVDSKADLRDMSEVLKQREKLSFDFEPTGYTRGDKVLVDIKELHQTLMSEKRLRMPKKIPKRPEVKWRVKEQPLVEADEEIPLIKKEKKRKPPSVDGVEDESQGRTTTCITLEEKENPQMVLKLKFTKPEYAVDQFASYDPSLPFRQGTYDLINVCTPHFAVSHVTAAEVVKNRDAVNKARRNFAKWFLARKAQETPEAAMRKDNEFINSTASMDQEFVIYLFAKCFPDRVEFQRAGETRSLDDIPDDCVPKWKMVGLVPSALKMYDIMNLSYPLITGFATGIAVYCALKGIIYLLVTGLKALGMSVEKPIDEAQSEDKFISRVQKQRAKQIRRAQGKHMKDKAQDVESAPLNIRVDLAKIVASSVPYSLSYDEESALELQGGWMFFIRGGMAVTTLHGFKRDSRGNFLKARGVARVEQEKMVFDPAQLQKENRILADVEKDRVWLVLSGYSSVDNRRLFKELQLEEPDNLMTVSVDKKFATHSSYTTAVRHVGSHQYRHGEEVLTNAVCFIADGIPGAPGDCGRVFLEKKENEVIIVGQHVAGGPTRSIVSHITRKHVDDALSYFVAHMHDRDKFHVSASEHMDVTQSGTFEPKIGSYLTWPLVGESKKAHYSPSTSGFSESFFIDPHFGEPVLKSDMKPALLRARGEIDPVLNYSKHFVEKESKDYFPHMDDPEVWKGVFPKSAYGRKYRMFTFEEVVYTPKAVGLESICRKTSPGGKWSLIGVNREQLLDVKSLWHVELKKRVYEIREALRRGEVPFEFHILCAKDEPRAEEKVAAGDTRFFLIGSLEMQIVYRMYFGWFLVQQQINREETDIQVGINPYSEEWNVFATQFLGQHCSDADIKKWDVNYPRRIAYRMPYVAFRIWDNVPYFEMQLLLVAVMQCRALIGNRLVLLFLLPSGFLLTAWLNSVVNSVSHRSIGKEIFVPLVIGVFGDDSVIGWGRFERDDVLDEIIRLRKLWYGWISTSADKTGAPTVKEIHQCQFLKRGFVLCDSGRFVCPLDKSSINKMLTWVQARTEPEMIVKTVQNISVAMMEASLHGAEYFDELVAKLEGRWRAVSPKSFIPFDYATLRYDTLHLETRLFR